MFLMKNFMVLPIAAGLVLSLGLASCKKNDEPATEGGKELSSRAKAQKDVTYEIIDKYFEEKGVDQVEKTLEKIIEKRRRGPSMEDRMKTRVTVDFAGAPTKGDANAPIKIVEFSDFSCPFCSRVNPTIDEVMKNYDGKVQLGFRHKPLPIHPQAPAIHIASMAAQEQGKFWEYHDLAFKKQGDVQAAAEKKFKNKKPNSREEMEKAMDQLGREHARKWAQELKLDMAKFDADMKRQDFKDRLDADIKFADENGQGGTPSFFVNGVAVVGAVPFDEFKKVIDALLAEQAKK
jgi:protein-disulfide isomerase